MQYPMKKLFAMAAIVLSGAIIAGSTSSAARSNKINDEKVMVLSAAVDNSTSREKEAVKAMYEELELNDIGLNQDVFEKAMKGFDQLAAKGSFKNDEIITIVDFSQPSTQKRMYVIDVEEKKILFNTLVSHGRNTGTLMAKNFSNKSESHMSSPGFYSTAETYFGSNGFSMRLDGLEKGFNCNARARAVVMHGAPYVSQANINGMGFIGRSWGCPAVPMKEHKQIINTIKNGTCLFIYAPGNYDKNSRVLNA